MVDEVPWTCTTKQGQDVPFLALHTPATTLIFTLRSWEIELYCYNTPELITKDSCVIK